MFADNVIPVVLVKNKETIMPGHDNQKPTILPIVHNMSTTYFGQYYFGYYHVGYNYRRKLHNK